MPSQSSERQPRMSVVLAFDCAVSGLAVAVVRGDTVLSARSEQGRDQSATLMPAIAETLREAGIDKRALSLIAVTIGPGSFTGVRLGLATARGLALALDRPLAGIATTRALLAQAGPLDDRLAVAAIDSHLGDWFCAIGAGDQAPFLASIPVLTKRLDGRACVIVGPQAAALAPRLVNAVARVALPDPSAIARLALADGIDRWRAANASEGLPRPLYLRGVNITLPDGARRTVD